jgi:hypothetical protein
VPARIASFLRNTSPKGYCDDCLATALGIHVSAVARETKVLAETKGFARERRVCWYCGSVRDVIRTAS